MVEEEKPQEEAPKEEPVEEPAEEKKEPRKEVKETPKARAPIKSKRVFLSAVVLFILLTLFFIYVFFPDLL